MSAPWFIPLAFAQQEGPLPDGPGVNLVYAKCQQCHPITYVADSAGVPDSMWKYTLSLMKQLGLHVTEEEEETLYQYFTTYLGTSPPPQPTAEAQAGGQIDGTTVYAGTCAVCHGAEGQGTPGSFPPLIGHAGRLAATDRSYLPLVVVYGLSGEVEIDGHTFDAVMPAWGRLSNDEIAAALNVVTGWDSENTIEPYVANEIEEARGLGLTRPEVRERRPKIH